MIRVENIKKTFNPHSSARNQVLKGVSFDLPDKGLVAIFGKSGSGKTTLLNILGGLEKADSGKITIDGEVMSGNVDRIRNQKIGFIFQNYYLERGYTIAEIMRNAMLLAGFRDEKEIARRSEEVLKLVDMERFKNKQGDALSGGQKQRVAIARALIKGADVILADEPTGNLDAQNTYKVMDILKEISKTKLVVLVTHEVTLIKKYADSHIKLVDGALVDDAEIDEAELAEITYGNVKEEPVNAADLSDFCQSKTKKNGKLFTLKNVLHSLRADSDRSGTGGNIFKQIFVFAMAIAVCFFSFFAFEALSVKAENKPIDGNSVYVSRSSYSEVRKLSSSLYNTIDFFEMDFAEGSFSYNNLQSLSGIKADYAPRALRNEDTAESIGLQFGEMPGDGQVLITRALAETIKSKLRIAELGNDRSLSLILFEKDYAVSGIVEGDQPYVYDRNCDVNVTYVTDVAHPFDPSKVHYIEKDGYQYYTTTVSMAETNLSLNYTMFLSSNDHLWGWSSSWNGDDRLFSAGANIGRLGVTLKTVTPVIYALWDKGLTVNATIIVDGEERELGSATFYRPLSGGLYTVSLNAFRSMFVFDLYRDYEAVEWHASDAIFQTSVGTGFQYSDVLFVGSTADAFTNGYRISKEDTLELKLILKRKLNVSYQAIDENGNRLSFRSQPGADKNCLEGYTIADKVTETKLNMLKNVQCSDSSKTFLYWAVMVDGVLTRIDLDSTLLEQYFSGMNDQTGRYNGSVVLYAVFGGSAE